MNVTGNYQLVKRINKSLVLQTLRHRSPLSRAELAQLTGLNKTTISSLVSELLDEQLLYESGPGQSKGGRRPVMLHFNGNAGYAIGIDLGVNYVVGILTDLNGKILREQRLPLQDKDYNRVLAQIDSLVTTLMADIPASRYGAVGIGIGVPGIVDPDGMVLLAPNLEWNDVQLRHDLSQRVELPVILENEANAGAYGEKMFGEHANVDELIYVSAGIGLGTGIIIDGKLYKGVGGYSGEMGHIIVEPDGLKCRCGSRGCWERYASEQAVLTSAQQLKRDHPHLFPFKESGISLEHLITLAESKNEAVIALFQRVAYYMGIGINNIINTFNPERVIIGNRLATAQPWLQKTLFATIDHRTLHFHRQNVTLSFSNLDDRSCCLGMASFVIEGFFEESQLSLDRLR
ncbi:ROK family transcriptional regulator [Desmospora activa]|uniref:Xylose repressor XylR n=1 Tax=Desmospora activa DSM 45169 TaxID=1121389 RepID=A0A2T4Z3W0_9BACL|nr:ROK family transcriptional regulator [Desmospora activa]PTM56580.1 xylose repressor XylR [Desmospora activa DSM 45169]